MFINSEVTHGCFQNWNILEVNTVYTLSLLGRHVTCSLSLSPQSIKVSSFNCVYLPNAVHALTQNFLHINRIHAYVVLLLFLLFLLSLIILLSAQIDLLE